MCEEAILLWEKPASEGRKRKGSAEKEICRDKGGHRPKVGRIQALPVRSAELMQCCCSETFIYLQPVVMAFAAHPIQSLGFLTCLFFFPPTNHKNYRSKPMLQAGASQGASILTALV